ncbi:MAG: hypothetical protein ACRD2S_09230 [Terriglobales bacterium]
MMIALMLAGPLLGQSPVNTSGAKEPQPDYSGMYGFLQEGEFVQLTVEDNGTVTGLVSCYSNAGGDHKTFVDHFFKQGKMDGKTLSFTTDIAQDISYEFKGTVERGEGKTPADEGFYVLKGTLTQNNIGSDKKTTSESQAVEFKSFPRDASTDAPK